MSKEYRGLAWLIRRRHELQTSLREVREQAEKRGAELQSELRVAEWLLQAAQEHNASRLLRGLTILRIRREHDCYRDTSTPEQVFHRLDGAIRDLALCGSFGGFRDRNYSISQGAPSGGGEPDPYTIDCAIYLLSLVRDGKLRWPGDETGESHNTPEPDPARSSASASRDHLTVLPGGKVSA